MGTKINDVVVVNITRETAKLTQAGFGTGLIFGTHDKFDEDYQIYGDMDAVADIFDSSDEEYKAANAYFGQELKPEQLIIGKRGENQKQITRVTVTAEDAFDYSLTINDSTFEVTSGVAANAVSIAASLISLASVGSEAVSLTNNLDGTYDIEADVSGDSFTVTLDDNQSDEEIQANIGLADELDDLTEQINDWYGLIICRRGTEAQQIQDIKQAAAWIETKDKIYGAAIDQSIMITSSEVDIASYLQDRAYDHTFLMYSTDEEAYPEAAWMGKKFPYDPGDTNGNQTWLYDTLAGISVDDLSDTAVYYLKAKNCNFYEQINSLNLTSGKACMASGEYLDIIRGTHWLAARIAEGVFLRIVNSKPPFTRQGMDIIKTEIEYRLGKGSDSGLLVREYNLVTMPEYTEVDPLEKAQRYLNNVQFSGVYQGAIHKVRIIGNISF